MGTDRDPVPSAATRSTAKPPARTARSRFLRMIVVSLMARIVGDDERARDWSTEGSGPTRWVGGIRDAQPELRGRVMSGPACRPDTEGHDAAAKQSAAPC